MRFLKSCKLWACLLSLTLAASLYAQEPWSQVNFNGNKLMVPGMPLTSVTLFGTTAGQCVVVGSDLHLAGGSCGTGGGNPYVSASSFTGAQMNENSQVLINGADPLTEFQAVQGTGKYATEGHTTTMSVPSGSTMYQANASADYLKNYSPNTLSVAHSSTCRSMANGAKCWGENPVVIDTPGLTSGVILTNEWDVQPQNGPGTYVTGGNQIVLFAPNSGVYFNAWSVDIGQVGQWASAYAVQDGAVGTAAFVAGQQNSGNTAGPSQQMFFRANNGSGTITSKLYSDQFGDMIAQPVSGPFFSQNPTQQSGSNNVYSNGFGMSVNETNGAGGTVASNWTFVPVGPSTGVPGYEGVALQNSGSQAGTKYFEIPNQLNIDTPGGGATTWKSIAGIYPTMLESSLVPWVSGQCVNLEIGDPGHLLQSCYSSQDTYTGFFGFGVNVSGGPTQKAFTVGTQYAVSTDGGVTGPATAPSGSCSFAGEWVFSQDGHATYCNGGTWVTKI